MDGRGTRVSEHVCQSRNAGSVEELALEPLELGDLLRALGRSLRRLMGPGRTGRAVTWPPER